LILYDSVYPTRLSTYAILSLPPANELDDLFYIMVGDPLHGGHVSETPVMSSHARLCSPEKCIVTMVGRYVKGVNQGRPVFCRTFRPPAMARGTFFLKILHATAELKRYAGVFWQSGYRTGTGRTMVHCGGTRILDRQIWQHKNHECKSTYDCCFTHDFVHDSVSLSMQL